MRCLKSSQRNKFVTAVHSEYVHHLQIIAKQGGSLGASAQSLLMKYSEDQPREEDGKFGSGGGGNESASERTSSLPSYVQAEADEYHGALREAGIDPKEKISDKTDVTATLNQMYQSAVGDGKGYLGEREYHRAHGSEVTSRGSAKAIARADSFVKDAAIKNNWSMEHLALFVDSRVGRAYGDRAFAPHTSDEDMKRSITRGVENLSLTAS